VYRSLVETGVMDSRYIERREQFEKEFSLAVRVDGTTEVATSPSGRFQLEISEYSRGKQTGSYSRGIVTRLSDDKQLADVKRNYGHFWYSWIEHPNGKEYLLCGEDYQGYSTLNLTEELYHVHFPEAGFQGFGFCWAKVFPSPDRLVIAVDGCYWGGPYDLVFYDFRTPDALPYRELGRSDSLTDTMGWKDNDTFVLARETETRAGNGKEYASLTQAEQEVLDADESLVAYRTEIVEVPRPHPNLTV
jgi:hypothetical protein